MKCNFFHDSEKRRPFIFKQLQCFCFFPTCIRDQTCWATLPPSLSFISIIHEICWNHFREKSFSIKDWLLSSVSAVTVKCSRSFFYFSNLENVFFMRVHVHFYNYYIHREYERVGKWDIVKEISIMEERGLSISVSICLTLCMYSRLLFPMCFENIKCEI